MSKQILGRLDAQIEGELFTDDLHRILFATDASVYRELPLGVVFPKQSEDIQTIIRFCSDHSISIIPRAGGTSLAGQCVGSGLVVDISKYLIHVLEVDVHNKTARVQPGVIRDELNYLLKSDGLMVGPNTSTANRATIGGMVGNNSCGTTSIVHGSTRDHIVKLKGFLSDGSDVEFRKLTLEQFNLKCTIQNLEGDIYRHLKLLVTDEELQNDIRINYPRSTVKRRNTGYALDLLLENIDLEDNESTIDVCKLICGSEGTLVFISEVTIGLVDVPPANEVLVALQFPSVSESLSTVPFIMNFAPFACELMDKTILDCTKGQRLYEKDRHFLKGDPEAVLLVSFVDKALEKAELLIENLIQSLKENAFEFEYSIVKNKIDKIWNLRKAGLGLLANLPGDDKAVACIEDTAVAIEDLSSYIDEFGKLMDHYGQKSVYYAHAGAGEIHLRPILNLKKKEDRELFYQISLDSARLVKKYKGSLSGEHGDGRVRAPFIRDVYSDRIYDAFCALKRAFDEKDIFNPGKIVNAKKIDADLRYEENHNENSYDTMFDFSDTGGILRAAEKCNGSGDCRKLPLSGGTMCPSYMATRNERETTRGRANVLREILSRPDSKNAWDSNELKEAMDLCLSCKGCTSECPSNVDMSTLKAEFLHQFQKANGTPFRSKVFTHFARLNALASYISPIANFFIKNTFTSSLIKKGLGVHSKRSIPVVNQTSLRKRYEGIRKEYTQVDKIRDVYLFIDEFSNYNDHKVGEKAVRLLFALGYNVKIADHQESGRAAISKGSLDYAKKAAEMNVQIFNPIVDENTPLLGIEPSAILTFCDEYPRLVREELRTAALELSKNVFTIETFLYKELIRGVIKESSFHSQKNTIFLHGHCHQKALTDMQEVAWLLSMPGNYQVEVIPSGCCGMAGSFGYETEHYDLSMEIGELVLFPAVRSLPENAIVVASGTSCRHQIYDGTGYQSKHAVEVLYDALNAD